MVKSIEWTDEGVVILDQLELPAREVYRTCTRYEEVADAIRRIRGVAGVEPIDATLEDQFVKLRLEGELVRRVLDVIHQEMR